MIPLIANAHAVHNKKLVQTHTNNGRRVLQSGKELRPFKPQTTVGNRKVAVKKRTAKVKTSAYNGRHYSKDEVKALIVEYAEQYKIKPDSPLCIAEKESGYQGTIVSPSGKYHGVFQYSLNTWRGTDESKVGMHVLDANANIKAAVKFMAIHIKKVPSTFPSTSKKCPPITPIN